MPPKADQLWHLGDYNPDELDAPVRETTFRVFDCHNREIGIAKATTVGFIKLKDSGPYVPKSKGYVPIPNKTEASINDKATELRDRADAHYSSGAGTNSGP